ncbi:MAG: transcriptional regulator NanR [Bryobacteraceae bacterium]
MLSKRDEQIVRRKLSQEVVERLLREIESGGLPPGERLPSERELMDIYGVGRPAVREALQSLESMGLITITHGERARVVAPNPRGMFGQIDRAARHLLANSPSTVEHLKEARVLFEVGMAKIAAARATAADIDLLRRTIEEMSAARGETARFVTADIAFHNQIASVSRNPICTLVSEAMLQWLRQFHLELVHAPGKEEVTLAEHDRIFNCVKAGDVEGAGGAMADHLTRANQLYEASAAG